MAETNGPNANEKKQGDELPAALPPPEPAKLDGCGTAAGIGVAIFVLLVVAAFGLFVGACWK